MRVALAAYMDFTGPGPIHMYNYAIELARQGIEPVLFVFGDPETHRLMAEKPLFEIYPIEFEGIFLSKQTQSVIDQKRPDIVHLWTPRSVTARFGIECAYRVGSKIIIHFEDAEDYLTIFHGADQIETLQDYFKCLSNPGQWSWKIPLISALVCRYAHAFTAITKTLQSQLEREWDRYVTLLYPGIDLERFNPAVIPVAADKLPFDIKDRRIVLYSGSIGAMHEFDVILKAIALVKQQYPEALLLHLGRNLIENDTARLTTELGITQHARFLGHMPHKDIPQFLALGEILLQGGSSTEFNRYRLPSKLPEYLAMGKPVITFNEGFGQELVDGVEVIKTYTGSAEEIADRINYLFANPAIGKKLQRHARAKAEALFDWHTNSKFLIDLYSKVTQTNIPLSLNAAISQTPLFDLMLNPRQIPPRTLPKPIKRILIVTPEMLPLPGQSTSGAGLRTWALGEALQANGYTVIYSIPTTSIKSPDSIPKYLVETAFVPPDPSAVIRKVNPDAVLFCHWPVLAGVKEPISVPVILDLAGPHFLERLYMKQGPMGSDTFEKLSAISRADFFTCAGDRQRAYFLPWLMAAGIDIREQTPQVIPISMSPVQPKKVISDTVRFTYSGIFLPWQNPGNLIDILVDTLQEHPNASLDFFGGLHPFQPLPGGVFLDLEKRLRSNRRVQFHGIAPFDRLVDILRHCTVAFDLMQPNVEREVAFNVRTVVYMWCGLPVIYNNYAELSSLIERYNAGWTVDPEDTQSFRNIVASILQNPEIANERGRNAQQLVRELLSWDHTTEPLLKYLAAPFLRSGNTLTQSIDGFAYSLLYQLKTRQLLFSHEPNDNASRPAVSDLNQAAELERVKNILHQRESELQLTQNHVRNLEAFRGRVMKTPTYRLYKFIKALVKQS